MPTSRRLSVPFIVMFGVIIAAVAFAGPASASPYKDHPRISVSSEHPKAGSRLTVCGSGFARDTRVTIKLDGRTLSSVDAHDSGHFCTTIRLPEGVTGAQTIVATGADGRTASVRIYIIGRSRDHDHGDRDKGVGRNSSAPIKVALVSASAEPAGMGGVLAFSGAAVLLLVGGGVTLLAGRRRKVNS